MQRGQRTPFHARASRWAGPSSIVQRTIDNIYDNASSVDFSMFYVSARAEGGVSLASGK